MQEQKITNQESTISILSTNFDPILKVNACLRFTELTYQFAEYPEALDRLFKLSQHEDRVYTAGNALCKIAIEQHRQLMNMQFENKLLLEEVAKLTAQLEKPL